MLLKIVKIVEFKKLKRKLNQTLNSMKRFTDINSIKNNFMLIIKSFTLKSILF